MTFFDKHFEPISHSLWINEFAPTKLSQIIGNADIIQILNSHLSLAQKLPNLLLCGPNGCGKTTAAKILVRDYLGAHYEKCHMEIIGSIYRGKNVVSEKYDKKKTNDSSGENPNIVNFIRKKDSLEPHKCKIVIIYDFDCMTYEAQMALRRIIEIYSQKVRFIFICNHLNDIIEAIQSRTLILKFQSLCKEDIIKQLEYIAKQKGIVFEPEIYLNIGCLVNGDLKQAINYLQVFSQCPNRTIDNFYHLFNIPPITTMICLISTCLEKNATRAFTIIKNLSDSGYNVNDILDILIKVIIHYDFNPNVKTYILEKAIEISCLNEQVPSIIHLYRLITYMLNKTVN